MITLGLENQADIDKKMAELAAMIDNEKALNVMQSGADGLAGKVRSAAAEGPTGNLKKGVVAKTFKKQVRGNPASFVGIDYSIAPHAHLVEFGTRNPRRVLEKKVLYSQEGVWSQAGRSGGQTQSQFLGKEVEPMPAHPFFRPTIDGSKDSVRQDIADGLKKIITDMFR